MSTTFDLYTCPRCGKQVWDFADATCEACNACVVAANESEQSTSTNRQQRFTQPMGDRVAIVMVASRLLEAR